ncbi:hypothetical protein ACH4GP_07745 [Streptomyces celluloflavus]|uniref:Uncharacterized protein n=1 Tax=Streptomyces celluloflavus TaxID=58344 RepID=A0ABW7RD77_9ACTN
MNREGPSVRLLPWTNADGRPCYLSSDGTGPVSRLADRVEAVQLGLAARLLGHARDTLAAPGLPPTPELGFLAAKLADALHDTLLIAESRGTRLAPADDDANR